MKTHKRFTFVCCVVWSLLTCSVPAVAQEVRGGDFATFVELLCDAAGDDAEEEWGSEVMEELYERYCHPLNLNDLHEEQLTELPFLSAVQVVDVADYAERHRPMLSTGELMSISSLDYSTRRLLQLFCVAGPLPRRRLTFSNLLSQSDNDLSVRTDVPLYTRMGFAQYPASVLAASPNKVYQGSQPYLSVRYATESMGRVEAGFQLEKDVGESGVDYWAAYAILRRTGPLDVLAVGDYRISFGQGLVVNTSSGFGKMMMLSNIGRMDRGIRRHSSMQESGYMSGVAGTVRLGSRWRLSAFFSRRHADGTILDDSSGVSSMKTDGLHRTQLEKSKQGNLQKTDFGGNVSWQGERLRLSATLVQTHFSLPLCPRHDTRASLYRLYNASGADFTAYSLAYRYVGRRFTVSGETASTADGGLATLNALQTELGSHRLTLIGRYFTKNYVSINGKTFGDNAHPQNESGVFVGWHWPVSRKLTADAYADVMYFPWLKYQVSQSSAALEAMAQLTYESGPSHLWNLRLRVKGKQRDWKEDGILQDELLFHTTGTARLMHVYGPDEHWRLKSALSGTMTYRDGEDAKVGWGWSETLTWRQPKRLQLSLFLTLFHTDGYATRIYQYEPSLLYSFGMASFFDQGVRTALLATVHLFDKVDVLAKIGHTHLFKKHTIGTGLDLIPQSHREDLQLQLRYVF